MFYLLSAGRQYNDVLFCCSEQMKHMNRKFFYLSGWKSNRYCQNLLTQILFGF